MHKMREINCSGISELIVVLLLVAIGVATLGTYKLVNSNAQRPASSINLKPDVQPDVPQPTVDEELASTSKTRSLGGLGMPTPPSAQNGTNGEVGAKIAMTARKKLGKGRFKSSWPGAWCAAFASWTWKTNDVKIPYLYSASSFEAWGKKHHKWHSINSKYVPSPGDVAVYGTVHIGVVAGKKGSKIKMVDGNWSGRVSIHTAGKNYSGGNWGYYKNFYAQGQRVTGFVSP